MTLDLSAPSLVWMGTATLVAMLAAAFGTRGASWEVRSVSLLGAVTATLWLFIAFAPRRTAARTAQVPSMGRGQGYATSDACAACHPGQYDTWHDSFHRTMTQLASDDSVRAPFDGRTLSADGYTYDVYREGGRFMARLHRDDDAEDEERPVVMTTGSHHLQAYWMPEGDHLVQLPFVYFIDEQRWLPNVHSFLQPPPMEDRSMEAAVWNEGCVHCHSTGGPWSAQELGSPWTRPKPIEPGHAHLTRPGATDTVVTELGVACERCHGPADEHARVNRSPLRRYQMHVSAKGDETIVNPRRLDHRRSTALCGVCHTVCEEEPENARPFMPGERMAYTLDIPAMLAIAESHADAIDPDTLPDEDRDVVEAFWRDGSARIAGREYDGVVQSECYLQGEMSCTSCHRVHGHRPDGQVPEASSGLNLCGSCHSEIARDVEGHTHHRATSVGSDCLNCHMPHASYGLLSATRTHRLGSPSATGLRGREMPNACNLCHLDRSIRWTAGYLAQFYQQPLPDFADFADDGEADAAADEPAGAVWMVRGDPVQRAVAGWHMGWEPTREASDVDRLRPALGILLADPYSAVRQIAGRSARAIEPSLPVDLDALTLAPQPDTARALGQPGPGLPLQTLRDLLAARVDVNASIPE